MKILKLMTVLQGPEGLKQKQQVISKIGQGVDGVLKMRQTRRNQRQDKK